MITFVALWLTVIVTVVLTIYAIFDMQVSTHSDKPTDLEIMAMPMLYIARALYLHLWSVNILTYGEAAMSLIAITIAISNRIFLYAAGHIDLVTIVLDMVYGMLVLSRIPSCQPTVTKKDNPHYVIPQALYVVAVIAGFIPMAKMTDSYIFLIWLMIFTWDSVYNFYSRAIVASVGMFGVYAIIYAYAHSMNMLVDNQIMAHVSYIFGIFSYTGYIICAIVVSYSRPL